MSGEYPKAVLMNLTDWMPTPLNINNSSSVMPATSLQRVRPLSVNDRTTQRGIIVSERMSERCVDAPEPRLSPDCIVAIHQLMH